MACLRNLSQYDRVILRLQLKTMARPRAVLVLANFPTCRTMKANDNSSDGGTEWQWVLNGTWRRTEWSGKLSGRHDPESYHRARQLHDANLQQKATISERNERIRNFRIASVSCRGVDSTRTMCRMLNRAALIRNWAPMSRDRKLCIASFQCRRHILLRHARKAPHLFPHLTMKMSILQDEDDGSQSTTRVAGTGKMQRRVVQSWFRNTQQDAEIHQGINEFLDFGAISERCCILCRAYVSSTTATDRTYSSWKAATVSYCFGSV